MIFARGPTTMERGRSALSFFATIVERLRSIRPEPDRGTSDCGMPARPRKTVISVHQIRGSGGVGINNLRNTYNDGCTDNPRDFTIGYIATLQRPPQPQLHRLRQPGNLVGDGVAHHQRRLQCRELFGRGYKFDHDNPFHLAPTTTLPLALQSHLLLPPNIGEGLSPTRC
ncbi:hypothetical protein R4P64_29005 [Rhodococcus sp. IEGM 1366]|uniref:hypothetical protein n=1 Tax=Rhodococcus sp. IEGM 1366 TaxID=3082223 RepID=UPI0029557257|nr:hypothetical protein [Rhodococcus sp. IEGM 1366]MDV8070581.1 hypothetical protein [Rhodococcus sp. IEGM 1366]